MKAEDIQFSNITELKESYYVDILHNGERLGNIKFGCDGKYEAYDTDFKKFSEGEYTSIEDTISSIGNKVCEYFNSIHREVIWFNTWFSSITNVISELKGEFKDAKFIGTNISEDCTYVKVVDEFYLEPKGLTPEEYLDFALEVCKQEKVTIFFPKYYSNIIAKNKDLFSELGVRVVCEEGGIIEKFNSKHRIYEILKSLDYDKIPDYQIVNSLEEFKQAYKLFNGRGETVCSKFDRDEGARSFRVITNGFLNYKSLTSSFENTLTYENMLSILENRDEDEQFKPLMVMPKLLSPEVSIDCYNSPQAGFIAIPRYKLGNRIKEVKLTQELIEDCKRLQGIFNFKSVYNVQYRWDKNSNPKLLEINTRMSGGIHLSSLTGFSIPKQLLADMLNRQLEQTVYDIRECRLTQYENPIKL